MSIKCELKKLKPVQLGSSWNSTLMKACVPIYWGLWNACKKLWNRHKLFCISTVNYWFSSNKVTRKWVVKYHHLHSDSLMETFPDERFLNVLVQFNFFSVCFFFQCHILERWSLGDLCKCFYSKFFEKKTGKAIKCLLGAKC